MNDEWTLGPPPYTEGYYEVEMKNGDKREVVRSHNNNFCDLEFSDCKHPLQNINCHVPDVVRHRRKNIKEN